MALKSWLASLKADVSGVSGVQAPVHAGLSRYVTEAADVSGASRPGGMVARDTAETVAQDQTYQAKPAWALGCTGDTADTCGRINADSQTTETAPTLDHPLKTRIFRKRGPWLTARQALDAKPYHAHHFHCAHCIAAGREIQYARRCDVGLALWNDYFDTDDLHTEGGDHGQA
jgi:hypothetical protein